MDQNTRLPIKDGGREAVPDGAWDSPRARRRIVEPIAPTETLAERWMGRFRSLPRQVQVALTCAVIAMLAAALLIPLLIRAGAGTAPAPGGDPGQPGVACSGQTDTGEVPSEAVTVAPGGTEAVTDSFTDTPAAPDPAATVAEPGTQPAASVTPDADTEPSLPEPNEAGTADTADMPGTVRRDMSESERGARYLRNDTDRDPLTLPPWVPDAAPAVLLVCSQPYAAYADGDGDGASVSGGTVGDLTEQLAALLRAHGLPVVCVSADMTGLMPDDSLAECRERVQALTRYCCRLYGNITLIIDLRRSAEVYEGCLLAATGRLDGQAAAQLRVIADARRTDSKGDPVASVSDADCALALALREALYRLSPTVSRPVLWRASAGLVPAGLCARTDAPRLLTVEVGAAGNRFSEAQVSLGALAQALGEVLGR